jgi:hypothetical protein
VTADGASLLASEGLPLHPAMAASARQASAPAVLSALSELIDLPCFLWTVLHLYRRGSANNVSLRIGFLPGFLYESTTKTGLTGTTDNVWSGRKPTGQSGFAELASR